MAEGICREIIEDKAWKTAKLGKGQCLKHWSLINVREMINSWELNKELS